MNKAVASLVNKKWWFVLLAVISFALAACGGESSEVKATPKPVDVIDPLPVAERHFLFGETSYGKDVDSTVYSVQQLSGLNVGVTAVDIKVCSKLEQPARFSSFNFQLRVPEGGRYGLAGSWYGGTPTPDFPVGEYGVNPGECVRGWLFFDTPSTAFNVWYENGYSGYDALWS